MKLNSPSFHSRLEAKWQMSGPHRDAWAGAGQPGARQACHYVPGMGVSGDTTTDSCAHITAIPQWKIGETSLPTAHSQTEPPPVPSTDSRGNEGGNKQNLCKLHLRSHPLSPQPEGGRSSQSSESLFRLRALALFKL